ncbi:ABC transporter ATP-binding protein [Ensifer sp. YR511]|uniref:dipeptide ABC transporter ATP-binding protein n=1 Tax=Ensifer sp. YR511 TaxID=1855294 RepID=UPI0008868271|nr:ABC transporter ATP-binding protein [Ensifer sp. YR511]SDN42343.1 peptide/nickel transport system ATP-binding protein [Ensifer sp. YR511]
MFNLIDTSPLPEERDLLTIEALTIGFKANGTVVPAVTDVNWSVKSGETLVIIGESGSGKSVTASAIMGLLDVPPAVISSGRITFEGLDLLEITQAKRRNVVNGRGIAMVFQDPLASLNPVFTVGQQIAETMHLHGVSRAKAKEDVIALLTRVGIKNARSRAKDYPHQFSGGQRQRVMIAMAIALSPALLIADEPTSALDVTIQAQILTLLKSLQADNGMGMIFITHDINVAAQIGDKVAIMSNGRVVEAGPVREVLSAPRHEYTKMLLSCVPGSKALAEPVACDRDGSFLSVEQLNKIYSKRSFNPMRRKDEAVHALKGVSFNVNENEIVCVVGESGSGKSTLVKSLLGLEAVDSGKVSFCGSPISTRHGATLNQFRRNVQAVFQDPTASLNPLMTVAEIVAEPWHVHTSVVAKDEWEPAIGDLLETVGLRRDHAHRFPHQFSGGQRQRIAIARALASRPRLIVCDEAVSALDVSVQARILDLLRKLKAEAGLAILFVTHDLALVRDFADRVIVMSEGHIVEQGFAKQIFEAPTHPYTRTLLASQRRLVPGHTTENV